MQSEIPEWVQVWRWARTSRRPLELRAFPHQDQHGREEAMTMADYETLANEWRSSGSPAKTTSIAEIVNELAASGEST